jgi:ketosteroid isomerase-like protein
MSEQDNIRLVKQAYDCFKRGAIDELVNLQAEDVEWVTPGPPDVMRTAGTRRGRQGVAEFFSTLSKEEDIEVFEPQEFIAQDDKVVSLVKCRVRVKATGKAADITMVHVFSIQDGKVKRFREFFDTAEVLKAFVSAQAAGSK